MASDYYSILGLTVDATPDEIRAAFFDAARRLHPDANPEITSSEMFQSAREAYEVLSNPAKRADYDASLGPNSLVNPAVSLNILTSRAHLPWIKEPQVFYALMELACTAEMGHVELPPAHVCLVIDRSNSMLGPRIDMVKANIVQAIKQLKAHDVVSVVTFSDRADVIIPPTRVSAFSKVENRIHMIQTGGGTEIYQGLFAGLNQLRQSGDPQVQRLLILLTDGHTYGDDAACMRLAEQANVEGISINALGIGHEWNDQFLDQLTSLSGGSATLVSGNKDLTRYFEQKLSLIGTAYGRGISLEFRKDPALNLKYAFRLSPEITPVPVDSPIPLGNLHYGKSLALLLEFEIQPLADGLTSLQILNGRLKMQVFEGGMKKARMFVEIKRPVSIEPVSEKPPAAIVEALARLTLYRMQEKARQEVSAGEVNQATRRLQNLATHLLTQGNPELAHTVLMEAEHIRQSRTFSKDGDKRIKYGTRALLLPAGLEYRT